MKINLLKASLIISANLLVSAVALAGFDITRMTTVVDDMSGSYTVTKSGRLDEGQFSGTSLTEFNQFHPGKGEQELSISGVISKENSRGDGQRTTVSDGDFTVENVDNSWHVSFENLTVEVNDEGVELSGEVVINDESYDVNDLPEGLAKLLRRVFWLTRR